MSSQTAVLQALIEPVVAGLGYELVGIEYLAQGRRSVLRIYIDSPNGISLEDCETVSHQVSGVLDVEDPIRGEYSLEVSSPGMDRPLFTVAHFQRFIGQMAQVRTKLPIDARRKFKGVIVAVAADEVTLNVEGKDYRLAMELIDKANLIPEFKAIGGGSNDE
ncbi:MAG: ribosome maturation factor RimP [Gammaproteobacteria bacterium]|nr:ribosome maturation factor RimP [Gammaproteobacteria bacterium]